MNVPGLAQTYDPAASAYQTVECTGVCQDAQCFFSVATALPVCLPKYSGPGHSYPQIQGLLIVFKPKFLCCVEESNPSGPAYLPLHSLLPIHLGLHSHH